jgi:hypothetical protein
MAASDNCWQPTQGYPTLILIYSTAINRMWSHVDLIHAQVAVLVYCIVGVDTWASDTTIQPIQGIPLGQTLEPWFCDILRTSCKVFWTNSELVPAPKGSFSAGRKKSVAIIKLLALREQELVKAYFSGTLQHPFSSSLHLPLLPDSTTFAGRSIITPFLHLCLDTTLATLRSSYKRNSIEKPK